MMRRLAGIGALTLMIAGPLEAAPARLALIYGGAETTGPAEIRRAVAPLNGEAQLSIFAPGSGGDPLTAAVDLGTYDLVFVDGSTRALERNASPLAAATARTRVMVWRPAPTGSS